MEAVADGPGNTRAFERGHGQSEADQDDAVIIRALRSPGAETQLTRTIAQLAACDQDFARGFLRLLVAEAPYAKDRAAAGLQLERSKIVCEGERYVHNTSGQSLGRVDLSSSAIRRFKCLSRSSCGAITATVSLTTT